MQRARRHGEAKSARRAAAAPPPSTSAIPDVAIETLARGFCREAAGYGFAQLEYVKFVNAVLDESMHAPPPRSGPAPRAAPPAPASPSPDAGAADRLPLRGARVLVRAFDPGADGDLLGHWLSDTRGRDFLLSRITAKQADLRDLVRDEANTFGIVTLHDSTPVGAVAFLDHDPVQHKAEMRKLIGDPAQRGKGLAKEASALWIRYGLVGLGLKKIYVSTFHTDVRNVRLNQELGFAVEGILRNELLLGGTYHDVLRMALWSDGDPAEPGAIGALT